MAHGGLLGSVVAAVKNRQNSQFFSAAAMLPSGPPFHFSRLILYLLPTSNIYYTINPCNIWSYQPIKKQEVIDVIG